MKTMKKKKTFAKDLSDFIFTDDQLDPEYSAKFCGRLILIWRSDPAYLKGRQEPYQGNLFNGNPTTRHAKKIATIESKPDWFITLNYNTRVWGKLDDPTLDRAYYIFKRYTALITRRYPKAWFVWVAELAFKDSGLHFHLVGSFGTELTREEKDALIAEWRKMTCSKNKGVIRAKRAKISVYGYFFSRDKKAQKRNFRKKFPARRLFGIVGQKNITFAEQTKRINISAMLKTRIEEYIRNEVYISKNLSTKHFDKYVKREVYYFAFSPQKAVDGVKQLIENYYPKK